MILQQQYCQRGFTIYFELIKTLLQAERHNELLIWNSNKGPVGANHLLEVHATTQKKTQKGTTNNSNLGTSHGKNKCKRHRKPYCAKGKDNSKSNKNKSSTCAKGVIATTTRLKNVTPKALSGLVLEFCGTWTLKPRTPQPRWTTV